VKRTAQIINDGLDPMASAPNPCSALTQPNPLFFLLLTHAHPLALFALWHLVCK
jgi:hypothetical protein